jgi:hypothetical protein
MELFSWSHLQQSVVRKSLSRKIKLITHLTVDKSNSLPSLFIQGGEKVPDSRQSLNPLLLNGSWSRITWSIIWKDKLWYNWPTTLPRRPFVLFLSENRSLLWGGENFGRKWISDHRQDTSRQFPPHSISSSGGECSGIQSAFDEFSVLYLWLLLLSISLSRSPSWSRVEWCDSDHFPHKH